MGNIENIPLILHQIEGKFNALEIEKEKLINPGFFDSAAVNIEIARLEDEILPMKKLLMSEKDIQRQKDLMRGKLQIISILLEGDILYLFRKNKAILGNINFILNL